MIKYFLAIAIIICSYNAHAMDEAQRQAEIAKIKMTQKQADSTYSSFQSMQADLDKSYDDALSIQKASQAQLKEIDAQDVMSLKEGGADVREATKKAQDTISEAKTESKTKTNRRKGFGTAR